jgi:hypothetical protein
MVYRYREEMSDPTQRIKYCWQAECWALFSDKEVM